MKKQKGITLIALVITIILMLILAGVVLNLTIGNDGLMETAKEAKEETQKQAATEKINLKITNSQMQSYAKEQRMPTLQELANDFCEDEEIEYVELTSKRTASLTKIELGENKSFFTKLKDYPYEFEINASLQLASVDGIKNIPSETSPTNGATGVRTDAYIYNARTVASTYSTVTSMDGFTRDTDANHEIDKYLFYSNENGYKVLKSGWYFIKLRADMSSSASADTSICFLVNGTILGEVKCWTYGSYLDINTDAFSIYLKEGDNIYFTARATGTAADYRNVYGYCYPMF